MSTRVIAIIIISAIMFLNGCKEDKVVLNKNTIHFTEFPDIDSLFFKDIYNFKEGGIGEIKLVDSCLIVFNHSRNPANYIYNYSLKNKKLSQGYLRHGKGPGEAIGAFNWGIVGEKLWVQDITMNKILAANINELFEESGNKSFMQLPFEKFYNSIVLIDSVRLFGVGNSLSSYKIEEVEYKSGKILSQFGQYAFVPKDLSIDACKDAYKSLIDLKPSRDKLVLAYMHTDVIEIYDVNTHSCIAIQGPSGYPVESNFFVGYQGANFMDVTKNTRESYIGITTSNKYIYAMYNGHLEKDGWGRARYIHVFDWDGNPIKKYILTRHITRACVSMDDTHIYSHDHNTGYIIETKIK